MRKILINSIIILTITSLYFSKILPLFFLLALLFIYNYKEKPKEIKKDNLNSTLLSNERKQIDKQVEMFDLKYNILSDILASTFGRTSITYRKYIGTVDEIKGVFQKNIEDFNLKIALINEDELIKYHSTKDFKDINKILNENELILNKLNKLIISISEIDENEDIKQLIFNELENLNIITKNIKGVNNIGKL